jgi:hypothetical protein
MVRLLVRVVGIGTETADMLVNEVLSWPLRDRRAVARYAGLTGAPDNGGSTCAADAVAGPAQFRSATRVRPDSALRSAADVEYQVERYWSRPARVGIVPNRAHHPSGTRRGFRTVDRRPLRLSWRAFPPQRGSLAPSAPPPWPSGSKARHDHQQTFLVTTLVLD